MCFSKNYSPARHQAYPENYVVGPHWAVVFPQVVPYVPSPACDLGDPGKAK